MKLGYYMRYSLLIFILARIRRPILVYSTFLWSKSPELSFSGPFDQAFRIIFNSHRDPHSKFNAKKCLEINLCLRMKMNNPQSI